MRRELHSLVTCERTELSSAWSAPAELQGAKCLLLWEGAAGEGILCTFTSLISLLVWKLIVDFCMIWFGFVVLCLHVNSRHLDSVLTTEWPRWKNQVEVLCGLWGYGALCISWCPQGPLSFSKGSSWAVINMANSHCSPSLAPASGFEVIVVRHGLNGSCYFSSPLVECFCSSCICHWKHYQGLTCTHEARTESDFPIKLLFSLPCQALTCAWGFPAS